MLDFQTQVRGAPPPDELVVVDGKEPLHTGGQNILTAITSPGLHARLDVSRRDDESRMRNPHAIHLHGIFIRLANSLMKEWRSHQARPNQKTMTDFAATMSANHARRVIRTATSKNPNLRSPS